MNAGHVYVLALSNGTVKVGRTKDAGQRMNTHKSAARSLGLTVTDKWISPPHAEWFANERALKAIAAELGGTPKGPEVFSGVGFAAVVEKAQALTFTPPERGDAAPAARGQRWAALKADLARRVKAAAEAEATLPPEAGRVFAMWASAIKDVQQWMAQIEAEYPERAST